MFLNHSFSTTSVTSNLPEFLQKQLAELLFVPGSQITLAMRIGESGFLVLNSAIVYSSLNLYVPVNTPNKLQGCF